MSNEVKVYLAPFLPFFTRFLYNFVVKTLFNVTNVTLMSLIIA